MRRALLLLLVLVASGCTAPGAGDAAQDAQDAPRFLAPVVLGKGGPEPVVRLSPEGDVLYVAAQDAGGGSPHVWVSTDGGGTFVERRPNAVGGGEVDLATGSDGMVYLTQLGPRGNVVSVSRDHGRTWQTSPIGTQSQYFDREWLAVDSQERVFMVAREFGVNAAAGVARSDDRGVTFQPRGHAWSTVDEPGQANGNLVTRGTTLHLVYVCRDGLAVCVATSTDGATTFTRAVVAERSALVANVYPSLAATGDGLLVAWSDATSGALAVYTSTSRDGRSWTAPVRATPPQGTSTLPWVAARGDVAWLVYLHADAALAQTDSAAAQGAAWTPHALRLDLQGRPAGEPLPLAPEPVHRGVISPPVGQGSATARDRNFGDFFTALVTPAGKLVAAYSTDEGSPETVRDVVVRER